jgi:accessory colonization factor AcfC
MLAKRFDLRSRLLVLSMALGAMPAGPALAQDVIRLYGSVGPSPAMEEAAMVFATRNDVKVEVVSGPRNVWRDKAALNADLIFSEADFMWSDYARSMDLQIDESTITPLFLRPSAILVRPGNPKQINDFPDLVRPGINIMVVNSAGATGLWEDMAGKLEDIRTVRALRRNIVVFGVDSDEALTTWKTNPDIDAWITWNTWHIPLRGRAELVPVSKPYRVLRTCSIALTARGKAKPGAAQFLEFLKSEEAAPIFQSWGWIAPDAGEKTVTIGTEIAFACRIHEDKWDKEAGVGEGLLSLRRAIEEYKAIGVPLEELHVSAIFHGDAARWLLNDDAYRGPGGGREGENPNKAIIRELIRSGVSMEMCGQTMKEHGWNKTDLLPDIKVVPAAYPRLIDLELQGYGYVSF